MSTPRKPITVMTVTAKNRRTSAMETRRWTEAILTEHNAVARMGAWLVRLGWDEREIMIMSVCRRTEDQHTDRVRERLSG